MSYHGQPPPDYNKIGIAVVNPLHEQRKRLTQLEKLLEEIANETDNADLKEKIGNVLHGNK